MEGYICKECGAEAIDNNGKVIRTCEHNAPIILNLKVVVTGDSDVN